MLSKHCIWLHHGAESEGASQIEFVAACPVNVVCKHSMAHSKEGLWRHVSLSAGVCPGVC